MADHGHRPEPVAKLSDHLVVAAACSRCRTTIRVPFSRVAREGRLSCESCGQSWAYDLDTEALNSLDQNFRRLEDPIRDREAWVEVRPNP